MARDAELGVLGWVLDKDLRYVSLQFMLFASVWTHPLVVNDVDNAGDLVGLGEADNASNLDRGPFRGLDGDVV